VTGPTDARPARQLQKSLIFRQIPSLDGMVASTRIERRAGTMQSLHVFAGWPA
jgi:hypothetical protein